MALEHRPSKRRFNFQGLSINIEIDTGETKSGYDDLGQKWEHVYAIPYGEILGTEGEDDDPVDVYIGPDESAAQVFVVHQLNQDRTPDEDKVFLGFDSAGSAEKAYRDHGPVWGFGSIESMTLDQFKTGYLAANRLPAHRLFDSAEQRDLTGKERYGT